MSLATLIYNNDLTNVESCASPFNPHPNSSAFHPAHLTASVSETASLALNYTSIAPGFCWVPWWNSTRQPLADHVAWWTRSFGKPAYHDGWGMYVDYALAGGSVLGVFAGAARQIDSRPMLSWRMQDRQFANHALDGAIGYSTMAQFWYDHRLDPAYMVEPFNASVSVPSKTATMNWDNAAVVDFHQSLLLELLASQSAAALDGVELDFLRDAAFFRDATPAARAATMGAFVAAARGAVGPRRTAGLRVPPSGRTLDDIGLPVDALSSLLESGAVDYVTFGIGFYGFQPPVSDFAALIGAIRNKTGRGALLFEVTAMLRYGCAAAAAASEVGYQNLSPRDRIPPQALVTAAHLAYRAGADGIAAFNIGYYRPFEGKAERGGSEPPFATLAALRNRSWAASQPQLYFLSHAGYKSQGVPASRLPLMLPGCTDGGCALALQMEPPAGGWQRGGTLRLNLVEPTPDAHSSGAPRLCPARNTTAIGAALSVTLNGGALAPTTWKGGSGGNWSTWPESSFASWAIPPTLMRQGLNRIGVRAPAASAVAALTLVHLEVYAS